MYSLIALAIAVWLATGVCCYAFFHRVSYNLLDPIIVISIFIPFSAALLAVLCSTGLVAWDKFFLFLVALSGYLCGARLAGGLFSKQAFRQNISDTTSEFTKAEIKALLCIALAITGVLAALGLMLGAGGDNRQEFGKVFRPLLLLQDGLFLTSLVLLLSSKFPTYRAATWVLALAVLSIPFSGKGVFVPVLYWLGLRYFVRQRQVNLRTITASVTIILIGVGVMAITAYGKTGILGVFVLLGHRLWMSGDVYIYAYKLGGLSHLRGNYNVAFLPYIFHPLLALVGIHTYQLPLGSMLASEVAGQTVMTGPNPQLPVLLDFFFPKSMFSVFFVALLIGFVVIGIRPMSSVLCGSRVRFIRLGGLVAGIIAPSAGFIDNEQVLMYLVGIASVIAIGTLLDLSLRPMNSSNCTFPTPTSF